MAALTAGRFLPANHLVERHVVVVAKVAQPLSLGVVRGHLAQFGLVVGRERRQSLQWAAVLVPRCGHDHRLHVVGLGALVGGGLVYRLHRRLTPAEDGLRPAPA